MKIKKWGELEKLHPELLTLRNSPIWKFPEIEAGWFDLINEMMNELKEKNMITENFCVVQVKEKFGGLRFYVDSMQKGGYDIIWKYEGKSFKVCEVCGEVGKLRDKSGWWVTLCNDCLRRKEAHREGILIRDLE